MKVKPPQWTLRSACPECGQGQSLHLLKCDACANIVVACAEEGSLFAEFRDLGAPVSWLFKGDTKTPCPSCKQTGQLRDASGLELQNAGLSIDEYE